LEPGTRLRLFVALEPPPPLVGALETVYAALSQCQLPVRWVKPAGIHLTLSFLGDVMAERVPELKSQLTWAAGASRPLLLRPAGLGAFPNPRVPRTLWLGLQGELEPLTSLQGAVANAMEVLGFPRERRRFSPHLTLGRVRESLRPGDFDRVQRVVAECPPFDHLEWHATEVSLIQSVLKPSGAEYTVLGRFPL